MKYYQATVRYTISEFTSTGKEQLRIKRDQYLINSQTISSAEQTLRAVLGSLYDNFEIIGIRESTICGVINEVKDVLINKQETK